MINDKKIDGMVINAEQNFHKWNELSLNSTYLRAGKNKIKVIATKGGFNFEAIDITKK